jgi:hypothetical protein
MKRWLANFTLFVYLGAFSWGIVAHGLQFAQQSHPAMYFIVWDMFCGWSWYERRQHVIGEGESGRFYELDPAPWGEFNPFGNIGRRHYDTGGAYSIKFGLNTLKHTKHEPIVRLYSIEEYFAKKYNLPDFLWDRYYPEPKQQTSYYNTTLVVRGDGTVLQATSPWLPQQYARVLSTNEVMMQSIKAQPFMQYERLAGTSDGAFLPSAFYFDDSFSTPVSWPSSN